MFCITEFRSPQRHWRRRRLCRKFRPLRAAGSSQLGKSTILVLAFTGPGANGGGMAISGLPLECAQPSRSQVPKVCTVEKEVHVLQVQFQEVGQCASALPGHTVYMSCSLNSS